jgi:hypothetical protein
MNTIKMLMVAGMIMLIGCGDFDGLSTDNTADAGSDTKTIYVDSGTEHPLDMCATVSTKHFGGSPCLLQIPEGVECFTAILVVDGTPALADVEFSLHCDIVPQISVTGGVCSALERGAVPSVGCVH